MAVSLAIDGWAGECCALTGAGYIATGCKRVTVANVDASTRHIKNIDTRLTRAMTPNDINLTEWIGYIAATLTTSSFVPQALLILRTRNVIGISLGMYWTFTLGVALWLVYGWQMKAWPLIIANSITFALASTILITKLVVDRNTRLAQKKREARRKGLA